MKNLNKTKVAVATAMVLGTLTACDSGSDPKPENAPTPSVTEVELHGSAVKGTFVGAEVTVTPINNSSITVPALQTDADGEVDTFTITSAPGYAFNALHQVAIAADADSTMICDAVFCGDTEQGGTVPAADMQGVSLNTLVWLNSDWEQTSNGSADARFHANMLTTLASDVVLDEMYASRLITAEESFVSARQGASVRVLRVLGVDMSNADLFDIALEVVSAESSNALVDASADVQVLSLLNASFAEFSAPVVEEPVEGEEPAEPAPESIAEKLALMSDLVEAGIGGDFDAAVAVREMLLASLANNAVVTELGLTPEQVVNIKLPLVEESGIATGPVRAVSTEGATITARNQISENESGDQAFDGDPQTKWLDHNDWQGAPTVDDPSWIQVDFPEAQAISSLYITSANDAPDRDPENFHVLASNDGENWVQVGSFEGAAFSERFERQEFRFGNGIPYTSYRVNITKNLNNDGLMQLAEIEFVGPVYTSVDHTDPVGTATIVARSQIGDAEAGEMAFDNDPTTKWLDHNEWQGHPTVEDPSWVDVTFPEPVAVNTLALTSANDAPDRDPENFNLEGSNDGGVTWTRLGAWEGAAFGERFERQLFSLNNSLAFTTYRFNITKNLNNDGLMQIGEIELIGPIVAGEMHSHVAGATYEARSQISEGEAGLMAFDGDPETKWLDNNEWQGHPTVEDPSWVVVTLPEAKAVDTIGLISANDAPDRDPENFNLEGSTDGETWVRLGAWEGTAFAERFERQVFAVSNSLAFPMYRFNITKNLNNDGLMQVGEIELIGPEFSAVNLSQLEGAVYTARNQIGDAEAAPMAFDGNVETKWLDHNDWQGHPTVEDPSWVQVDLPTAEVVDTLAITSANDAPDRDPENFNLQGSNDGGETWTTIASWEGVAFSDRFERQTFPIGNGFAFTSYRLNITKNLNNDGLMQVAEIELIGYQD